jgi:glycosyltransferase involved in cell wall biosynthesis
MDDLARCLQAVEDRPQYFAELATAALQRAQQHYSWNSVIQKYERLFNQLVTG